MPQFEAEWRRELWTLCEALQALDDLRCPPPDWCAPTLHAVVDGPLEDRTEGLRTLRNRLIEYMAQFQKLSRAEKHLLRHAMRTMRSWS
jgi:hypothetical protein